MASFRIMAMTLVLISPLTYCVRSQQLSCASMEPFANKKTFEHCMDLPVLEAILHWTYDTPTSTLSMAFTAPKTNNGWVAWGLNPTGSGMLGSQALMAFKPKPSNPITVNTVDVMSYQSVSLSPISYNVTDLSVEDISGSVTIFGTWVIRDGESSVNTVWQAGPLSNDGKPEMHPMEPAHMSSKKKIDLKNGGDDQADAEAPLTVGRVTSDQKGGATEVGVSIVFLSGALLVSFF